ncbi:MAG: hypothetical protein RMJ35_01050 [Phycisphaerales bacterium]|nr:hypothetical protein [Phycisphaerales bacterium]
MIALLRLLLIAWVLLSAAVRAESSAFEVVAPLSPDASLDEILDALDARGDSLRSLVARVEKTEVDLSLGEDAETRVGRVVYQRKPDESVRIRASFDKVRVGDRIREDRVEYLLENGLLIDRTYRSRVENRQTLHRPGEKIDLFALGRGPFPLPIGQARSEVYAQFEVSRAGPQPDDPPSSLHVRLLPREGTELARKFKSIDVWIDPTDHMPRRVSTVNVQETVLTRTDFLDVHVNAPVEDRDFELEKIRDDQWQIHQD